MVDTIKIKAQKFKRLGYTTACPLHYRFEKQKGRFYMGKVLDPSSSSYGVYTKTKKGFKFKLGFERKKGVFLPAVTKGFYTYYKNQATVSFGAVRTSDLLPLTPSIFQGVKILQTRIGYFNFDELLDVAYIVNDPKKGIMSYVLYGEKFKIDSKPVEPIRGFMCSIPLYLKIANKISPAALKKLYSADWPIQKPVGKGRSRFRCDWEWERLLESLYSYLRNNTISKNEAISLADDFLSAIIKGNWRILRIHSKLRNNIIDKRVLTPAVIITLLKSLIKLSKKLTVDQLTVLDYLLKHNNKIKRGDRIVKGLEKLTSRYSGSELYNKVYKLFGGFGGILPNRFIGYVKLINLEPRIKPGDIAAAERSIGAKGALSIWKKFKVVRFGRYHPSVLKHMVKLAINPKHERDKPLVFVITAINDPNGVFHWGKNFKRDKRVRVIVVETNDYFKRIAWSIRNEYGIPDSMMFTAHGGRTYLQLGSTGTTVERDGNKVTYIIMKKMEMDLERYERFKKDFKGYFGGKRGFVVVNACAAGARSKGNRINIAQMVANVFNAEVRAARATEGLLSVGVVFDKHGRAILEPTFFEVGWPHFGLNYGGAVFYPNRTGKVPESVYNGAADRNTGWRVGAGFSVVGRDPSIDIFLGGSYALLHRLRFRADIGAHFNPISGNVSASFDPEIAVGLTNQLLLFGGGRFGATMTRNRGIRPLYQVNFGGKILIPFLNGELDIGGSSVNGGKPKFFLSFQGRF